MSFVRAAVLLCAALGFPLFAACSGTGSAPPIPSTPSTTEYGHNAGLSTGGTRTAQSATQSAATPPPSGWDMHITGEIVAVQSSTEFQVNAGSPVGYLNVYSTSTTTKILNGLTVKVGEYANVYGNGSASTYITATQYELSTSSFTATPTPAPTPTPANVPSHVMTAGLLYGYGGTPTSVGVSSVAPYMTWAQTDATHASEVRAAGVKVDVYINFWRNYTSDNPNTGYVDLKPGGLHADAEAKECNGTVIHDPTYGGGYEANALLTTYTLGHAEVVADSMESEFGGQYDALFSDDTGALWGIPTPCNYTDAAYKTATNSVHLSLGKTMFVNTLNAGDSVAAQVGYTTASNIIGAMCESCYAYWTTVSSSTKDYPRTDANWVDTENGEALMVTDHKIFWDYARAVGDASQETALRQYIYGSFLLTYSPQYAMLQVAFKTPSGFEVFPETGFVPENPLTTSSTAAGYARTGGAYMREFSACYYRGVSKGSCAVVVNPSSTASATIPATTYKYSHSLTISGYSVLDGGSVGFAGARPSSLAPASAVILLP